MYIFFPVGEKKNDILISLKRVILLASADCWNEFWSQPLHQILIYFSNYVRTSFFFHLNAAMNVITVLIPPVFTTTSLVQQLQPAGVTVISADLAVLLLVEAG